MRVEISDDNTEKLYSAERQLREKYGVIVSPNRLVNIILSSVEMLEMEQTVKVTMNIRPDAKYTEEEEKPARPVKKLAKSKTSWVTKI